jgi:3-oxoacyl-[acyl-carrier-protein] synthase-1
MNQPDNQTIVVTGSAVISPVGLDAQQACASIRAGITRFAEHPYYLCAGLDPEWDEEEPLMASLVPSIDPYLDGPERLFSLILPPLTQIISDAKLKRKELRTGAFLLALPQPDKVMKGWSLEKKFIPGLSKRAGLDPFKLSKTRQTGHTGMFSLIEEAIAMLISGEVEFCIVAGVDSYLLEERLEFLDQSWRIKSGKNVDGYIPGEAASMILLERADRAKARNRSGQAAISSCGTGKESQSMTGDQHSSGAGLSEAIEKAVKQNEKKEIRWVICDLNGESYRSFEWGVVQTRMNKTFSELKTLTHPADCIGDVGAATGGVLISYAVQAFKRGYHVSDQALLWTASDDGLRAALCISRHTN